MDRVAILIDGAFFLKRLPSILPGIDAKNSTQVVKSIKQLVHGHVYYINKTYGYENPHRLLYKCFYYDAIPYGERGHTAIERKAIDFSKTQQAQFRNELFDSLKRVPNLVLRLGNVKKESSQIWKLKESVQKKLMNEKIVKEKLKDEDFSLALRQKGVDMRVGIDIVSIALKKHANMIVLVSGDSDFTPATKLARREGVRMILDSLRQNASLDLHEHVDGLRSVLPLISQQQRRQ